jgi:hypothetical protein
MFSMVRAVIAGPRGLNFLRSCSHQSKRSLVKRARPRGCGMTSPFDSLRSASARIGPAAEGRPGAPVLNGSTAGGSTIGSTEASVPSGQSASASSRRPTIFEYSKSERVEECLRSRTAALPVPSNVIAIWNGLIERCRRLDIWRPIARFQSELGPSNMLTRLFRPERQASAFSCRCNFNFGAF